MVLMDFLRTCLPEVGVIIIMYQGLMETNDNDFTINIVDGVCYNMGCYQSV